MVTFAQFTEADIARLISWISSAELLGLWAAAAFSHPLTQAQMETHLRQRSSRGEFVFKVLDKDQLVVGHVELGSVDKYHRSLRIGRVFVAPDHRRRGIGAHLMRAALAVAFDQLKMHRVELSVFDFNHAAIACYERVGFHREGVRREIFRSSDRYWSEIVMSILAAEWYASPVSTS
jgi:RimJ/RimL family protein N-acetyltransferase